MRFPKTPFMQRTFNLIDWVNEAEPGSVRLLPYYLDSQGSDTYKLYNNVRSPPLPDSPALSADDPFKIAHYIPEEYSWVRNPTEMNSRWRAIMNELRHGLLPDGSNLKRWIKYFTMEYNQYTMRTYLQAVKKFPSSVVNILETFNGSTGGYDLGLVEAVLGDLAFNWLGGEDSKSVEWFCIEYVSFPCPLSCGIDSFTSQGASQLAHALVRQLSHPVKTNTRVTAIRNRHPHYKHSRGLTVTTEKTLPDGTKMIQDTDYGAVISTIPLSTLALVDLVDTGINKHYAQWSAIRQLLYGSAVKVGIRFSTNWWESNPIKIVGGQRYV